MFIREVPKLTNMFACYLSTKVCRFPESENKDPQILLIHFLKSLWFGVWLRKKKKQKLYKYQDIHNWRLTPCKIILKQKFSLI